MRTTKARFKYTLRQCRLMEEQKSLDAVAAKLLTKDTKGFWKAVKVHNSDNFNPTASSIGGVSGDSNICDFWREHFKNILTSCSDFFHRLTICSDFSKKNEVLNALKSVSNIVPFSASDIEQAFKKLKKGKSSGKDGISCEHLIYCRSIILEVLFNSLFIHNYIPIGLLDTVIVPLIKDKKGDITDFDNYRPIALTCVLSKVLESLILFRCQCLL